MTQQLPEGFEIVEKPQGALPEGFSVVQPQAPAAPQSPTFGQRARAVGDVATTMVGGAIAEPIAGLSGLVSMPFGGPEKAAEVVQEVREVPSAIPKSELGQEYLSNIGGFFSQAADKINPVWRDTITALYSAVPGRSEEERQEFKSGLSEEGLGPNMGEAVLQTTGSPELAAIASTYPTAVLEALGLRGARNLKGDIPKSDLSQRPSTALTQSAPDLDRLRTQSRNLYREVDDLGYTVPQDDFVNLAINLRETLTNKGLDPDLTPKAERVLARIEDSVDQDLTISDIDTLRQLADIPAKALDNPREAALGSSIKEAIDDFIESQGTQLRNQGQLDIAEKITNARKLYGRVKRSELVNEAVERARLQQSGFENGLRIQFRQLYNNKKAMRGFSPAEREAIRKVIEGGGLENTMRALGKFGVLSGGGPNPQATVLAPFIGGSAAAALTGNPVVGVAVPVIGQVSRELATKMTQNNASLAQQVIRAGDNGLEIAKAYVRNVPKRDQSLSDLTELLMRSDVDLSTIKDMRGEYGTLMNDARFAAEMIRDMGLTSLVAAPGAAQGVQQEIEE